MRTEGTLKNWNDDRGFGFIVTTETKQDVFVHISSFPQTGRRPQPGERLAFSIESGPDGKKRAVSVNYLDPPTAASLAAAAPSAPRSTPVPARVTHASRTPSRGNRHVSGRYRSRSTSPRRVGGLLTMLAVVGIGAAIVNRTGFGDPATTTTPVTMVAPQNDAIDPPSPVTAPSPAPVTVAQSPPQPIAAPTSRFQCDGRTHCSQMTSCAEAEYFLRNCPGVQMDGNNDGEPCEQQWCH